MAEDKKKEDQKGDEAKKKGLPAIVLVALGAIVGGAGVVFAVPPKVKEVKVQEKPKEFVDVTHPDLITTTFNPRTRVSKGSARLSFKFVYRVREDLEDPAFEQLKENWDKAKSDVLLIFKMRSMEELQTDVGVRLLEHDLIQALDAALFPARSGEKLATVREMYWSEWILQ